MRLRLWPRTLAVQLIAVTALAVAVSDIGVALYFEHSNEQQGQNNFNDRMLDRAGAVAGTLARIPANSHPVVMRTMGAPTWKFSEISGPYDTSPMTDDEAALARRLVDALPDDQPKAPVLVRQHVAIDKLPAAERPSRVPPGSDASQIIVPIDNHTLLSGIFVRTPPQWPVEIMVAAATAIILASAAAAFMARRVVRPLSELTRAAGVGATSGNVPRVPESGPEDVRAAASAFNTMAEKVTQTLESQRHLLSAVGHDLRTPITAMRINLEFIADDDLREGLLHNLDELQEMTEQVLSAARGAGGEAQRSVDLSALVESLCADLDEIGEPVSWNSHAPAPISCRPNEIRRAVRNLVENAVAYGGKAEVHVVDTPGAYEILVEDEGPGIPVDDQKRVFEPFVRLESSRNEATGGTGLGLTLVKAIAEGHGGAVTLENRTGGGLRARLTLPRVAMAVS